MLIAEGPGVSSANSAERANTSHFYPALRFPLRVREVVGSIPEPSTAFVVRRNSRFKEERKIRSSIILLIKTFENSESTCLGEAGVGREHAAHACTQGQ